MLSPQEALQSFHLPPGYDIELVASEPMVVDPVAMDFDADGRLWIVEMPSYMPDIKGRDEKAPTGRIVVLEDTTGDEQMDKRTIYLDSLILPRAVTVLDRGVLVGAPPNLWMTRDTTGNLKADVLKKVREDFGDPDVNPEHNPNSLMWGMDNWIQTTGYTGRFRLRGHQLEYDQVPKLGQWGISMDNYGHIYRNSNANPIAVDYISPHYYTRNGNLTQKSGIYQSIYKNKTVWPIHPTAVNRGYRVGEEVREDGTLRRYTAASALAVYRGDQLPKELINNVFVPEPAGNLVQRYVIKTKADGSLIGKNPYANLQADFLTSTDERFRPVNIYSAPDGTLYIVDMYRGIIQHQTYMTSYLKSKIKLRGLEKPLGFGRIYRIVHKQGKSIKKPQLSTVSPNELAAYLEHPNGWWRDTAQRILVERQSISVTTELQKLVRNSDKDYARLHALWTLDGLDKINNKILKVALSDSSPHLRAAAIRIAEHTFSRSDSSLKKEVLNLMDDSSHVVQRQLAASIGEFPSADRQKYFLIMIKHYGNDPIVTSLVISGLLNQEYSFLKRLLVQSRKQEGTINAIRELAEIILMSGSSAHINTLLNWIGDEARPMWQRNSLLTSLEEVAPKPSSYGTARLFELERKPSGLIAAADSGSNQFSHRLGEVTERLDWPGKPSSDSSPKPLTPKEKERFNLGKKLFSSTCTACHQEDGQGMDGMAPTLVGSKWVVGKPSHLIRILLDGKAGDMNMPAFGDQYSNEELAAIATFVRQAWGNQQQPIAPSQVEEVRGASTGRDRPWTDEELSNKRH
ncbi:MAG TPA: c-type cytochrome [Fodinibius sp.]|nr:c-type cytochrome [Fodinibius sp.]